MFFTYTVGKKAWLGFGTVFMALAFLIQGVSTAHQNFIPVMHNESGIAVPILMYHSVLDHAKRGEPYIVSTQLFREDMLYLRQNGYTSVFVSDLVDYVYRGTPLPQKPVVITFDDGFLNNLTTALPVLEELDFKATVSVIGVHSEKYSQTVDTNPAYAHLTWEDIRTLAASGRIEIGNHTYDMHKNGNRKGCRKKPGESEAQYRAALKGDLEKLQQTLQTKAGVVPKVMAYPFGFYSAEGLPVLKALGVKAALTCEEKVNRLSPNNPDGLYTLGRFNRAGTISTAVFMKKLTEQ